MIIGLGIGLQFRSGLLSPLSFFDQFGTPDFAWSVQDLSGGNNAMTVLRSSDSTTRVFAGGKADSGDVLSWVNELYTIADEDFSSSAGWTLDASASITGGELVFTSSTSNLAALKSFSPAPNQQVRVTYTISNYVSGTVNWRNFAGGGDGISRSANGTYVETATLTSSSNFNWGFRTQSSFTGDIDNYLVEQLTADGWVTLFQDQAENEDFTQTTAASRPKIVDAGTLQNENGLAALYFDGVDDYMDVVTSSSLTGEFYMTGVLNPITNATVNLFLNEKSGSSNRFRMNNTGDFELRIGGAEETISSAYTPDNQILFSVSRNAANLISVYVNGSLIHSYTDSSDWNNIIGRLGANQNLTSSQFLPIKLQSLVVYDSDKSSERTDIEEFLNNLYSIY